MGFCTPWHHLLGALRAAGAYERLTFNFFAEQIEWKSFRSVERPRPRLIARRELLASLCLYPRQLFSMQLRPRPAPGPGPPSPFGVFERQSTFGRSHPSRSLDFSRPISKPIYRHSPARSGGTLIAVCIAVSIRRVPPTSGLPTARPLIIEHVSPSIGKYVFGHSTAGH